MPQIADIISARSPIYTSNSQFWQFYADHAEGGPGYAQKVNPLFRPLLGYVSDPQRQGSNRYVVQHALEDSTEYLSRLYRAPMVNLCGPAVDFLAGTVGASDTVTMSGMEEFQEIVDDCDLTGSSFLQFMQACRAHAATFGHTFVLADSTRASGELLTQADVLRENIRPYFREITPLDMLSWRLDSNGKPLEIIFRVQVEQPGSLLEGSAAKDYPFEYRYWSRENWIVYRENGEAYEIVDQGVNPLHEIPLSVLYHKKLQPFRGESLLKESAKYSQLLTNWLSDLDRTLVMQSFSQACIRIEGNPAQAAVGAARVIHLRPDRKEGDITYGAEDFFYRSPDAAPLQTMWDALFRIVDLANSSMSLKPEATTDKSHPESGISRAWRWHAAEKMLVQMATNEQETARSLFTFAAHWMGKPEFTGSIVYGTHFDLSSLAQDIESMLSLQTIGLPPAAQSEMKSRITKKALPNLPPDAQSKIDAEIKAQNTIRSISDRRAITDMIANQG